MDAALGLLFLAVYIVGIVSLAAGITWAVIRIFPTERNPKGGDDGSKPSKPEPSPANGGAAAGGGSLFRRSKRSSR